jgi:hypothetical protein
MTDVFDDVIAERDALRQQVAMLTRERDEARYLLDAVTEASYGREVSEFARSFGPVLRIADVVVKDRGKTNEINVLTRENRALLTRVAMLTDALEKHGRHNAPCPARYEVGAVCKCGLEAVVAAARGERT